MQQIVDQADIIITNDASLEKAIQQIARELRLHLTKRETGRETRFPQGR
jgi:dephospho-CoA kinase